jgi:hypothetical protein
MAPAAAGLAVVGESGEAMARPCGVATEPWGLYSHRAPRRHAEQSGRGSRGTATAWPDWTGGCSRVAGSVLHAPRQRQGGQQQPHEQDQG